VGERGDVGLAVGVEALSGHDKSLPPSGLRPSAIGFRIDEGRKHIQYALISHLYRLLG
jgi:hypothetical protein